MTMSRSLKDQSRTHDDLVHEALTRLIEHSEAAPEDKARALKQWRSQSSRHDIAYREAEASWMLMGHAPSEPLTALSRLRLGTEIALASASDYPGRIGVVACVMAAVALAPFLVGSRPDSLPAASRAGNAESYAQLALPDKNSVERIVTRHGEQREVRLPDGTTVWLNWNTEILVGGATDGVQIDVRGGDVLFSVPPAPDRTVLVRAGDAVVQSKASEFAVHSHGPEDALLQVRSGSVAIAGDGLNQRRRLGPAQQTFVLKGETFDTSDVSVASIASWQVGELVFDERPLPAVLHVLGHYTDRALSVGAIAEDLQAITATYPIDDADEVLVELAAQYNLELLGGPDGELVVQSVNPRDFQIDSTGAGGPNR